MLKLLLIMLILFPVTKLYSGSGSGITPSDLGLTLKEGKIERSLMSSKQKDTIAISLFTPEDYLMDIAVYSPTTGDIILYRNKGNGYLQEANRVNVGKDIQKIEAYNYYNGIELPSERSSIRVTYKNSEKKIISNAELITFNYRNNRKVRVPKWDMLDDAGAFIYDISFVEQWRSERNGQPSGYVTAGDIDRDGKNETIYTFYPINDTMPQYRPTRIVVFENISQNQYRIDWDTTLYLGGYNEMGKLSDFDEDGNYEFMSVSYFFNSLYHGLMECYGPGEYKWRSASYDGIGVLYGVQLLDSVNIGGITKRGLWACYSRSSTFDYTYVRRYRFSTKISTGFGFSFTGDYITNNNFTYSMSAGDIDRDGREEVILGDTQFGTNYVNYFDSTGVTTNQGYEMKTIIPNAPLSVGESFTKDYDGDGFKELTTCGIGSGSGSIGILKHTGSPGANQFNAVWWDSAGIFAAPNMGMDTANIDNRFTVLYSTDSSSFMQFYLLLYTFTYNGSLTYFRSSFKQFDSLFTLNPRFFDIDQDNKMNIISPIGVSIPTKYFLSDFEQVGVIGIEPIGTEIPSGYSLGQNYPNPFNPVTKIEYKIPKAGQVKLIVYDLLGRQVKVLVDQKQNAGVYRVDLNGIELSSGVYFYRLTSDDYSDTKKMILLK